MSYQKSENSWPHGQPKHAFQAHLSLQTMSHAEQGPDRMNEAGVPIRHVNQVQKYAMAGGPWLDVQKFQRRHLSFKSRYLFLGCIY